MKAKTIKINLADRVALFNSALIWLIPLLIVLSFAVVAAQSDMRLEVPALIAVTALVTALLAVTLYLGEKGMVNWSPAAIMAIAASLRLLFLFRQPELSDDIYRYLWDGLQTLSGHNPYALAPLENQQGDPRLRSLVNHSELVTIYPPAAQVVFAVGAVLGTGVLGVKLLLISMDLITCALILKLLSAFRMPSWRAVLYAWNPLPILEISASGHIDAAAIMFFLSSLLLLVSLPRGHSNRAALSVFAGLLFACAGLVKFLPVIFLPGCILLAYKGNRAYFLSGVIAGVVGLSIPFMPDMQNALTTLGIYLQHWEFSGFPFRTIRRITASGNTARILLAGLFAITTSLLYMNLLAKQQKEAGDWKNPGLDIVTSVLKTFYGITMIFLLLTPTLHPWYALYLACLLPFAAGPTGLIVSWSVFLSYSVLITYAISGQWIEEDYIPAIIWLAPVSGFFLSKLMRLLQNTKNIPSPLTGEG